MSKHPIPDWLRSQFSLIEDEVQKLGPCGVFTQMRTVTQTYFEQQAAAPQPPALGGEPELLTLIEQGMWSCFGYGKDDYRGCTREQIEETREAVSAHFAPLQAEIERLKYDLGTCELMRDIAYSERDQLKARRDELEKDAALLDYLQDQLVDTIYLDDGRIIDIAGRVTVREGVHAHMSKPAGSDQ